MAKTTRNWILGYFLLLFSCFFLIPVTSRVLGLAFLLSLVINAPAEYVSKKSSKTALSIVTGMVLLGFMFFLIYSAIPITINGVKNIATEIDALLKDGRFDNWLERMPPFISGALTDFSQNASKWLSEAAINVGRYVASNLTSWITGTILLIVAAFFIARRTGIARNHVRVLFPYCDHKKVTAFLDSLYRDYQTYVTGQLIISITEGVLIGLGSAIIGIPNALFLGLLAGITNFIPFLGVLITAIPMLVLSFVSKGVWGVFGAAVVLIIANQLDMWILSPRILSSRAKMNWFVVLVALLAFGELLGVFGVLFAVPLLLFARRFWKEFVNVERSVKNWESTTETGTKKARKKKLLPPKEEEATVSQED
jgi:predicted PurR-regulated permease PerM